MNTPKYVLRQNTNRTTKQPTQQTIMKATITSNNNNINDNSNKNQK